jgi:outer membrane biosynthesis protein TonB
MSFNISVLKKALTDAGHEVSKVEGLIGSDLKELFVFAHFNFGLSPSQVSYGLAYPETITTAFPGHPSAVAATAEPVATPTPAAAPVETPAPTPTPEPAAEAPQAPAAETPAPTPTPTPEPVQEPVQEPVVETPPAPETPAAETPAVETPAAETPAEGETAPS